MDLWTEYCCTHCSLDLWMDDWLMDSHIPLSLTGWGLGSYSFHTSFVRMADKMTWLRTTFRMGLGDWISDSPTVDTCNYLALCSDCFTPIPLREKVRWGPGYSWTLYLTEKSWRPYWKSNNDSPVVYWLWTAVRSLASSEHSC